jgi:hypothetical protein
MHCFAVRCATRPGECLAVTGSSPELGGWRRSGIKLMEQQGLRWVNIRNSWVSKGTGQSADSVARAQLVR